MITYSDELYHHGIKGQKWGVRRYQNADGSLTAAGQKRYDISEQKKVYKQSQADYRRAIAYGDKKQIGKAEINAIDQYVKLKALKSRNSEKKEFKEYRKQMSKTGVRGSLYDVQSMGRSTRLYDHLAKTKGKEYADRVEKKVKSIAIRQAITAGTVAAGSIAVSAWLTANYG